MDGYFQDWAENQEYIDYLTTNWFVVIDTDVSGHQSGVFPRVIYTKYVGRSTWDDSDTFDTISKFFEDTPKQLNQTLLDFLFPDLGKPDGQSEDGFGTVDGNGLFGFGLFPNLGRWLKPLLTKLWWLLPLLILVLIFKFYKKK